MAGVREATGVRAVLEGVGHPLTDDDAAEGDIATVHAFGEADEVGSDVPVVDGKPLSTAPKASHDLIRNEQDAVLVAELPHASQVAGRRHQNAVGAHHWLQDDGRDGARSLHHDRVGQVLEGPRGFLCLVRGIER